MSASRRLYAESRRLPKHQPLPWKIFFRDIFGKDVVLWMAAILAAASCFVSDQPLSAYSGYIDFKTLACLFSLMTASGGFMLLGLFDAASAAVVDRCRTTRLLLAAMVTCTFFSSMFITNDVALIVFVPMTLMAYKKAGVSPVWAVTLQTVAANVGSAFLPMGNPQNLFLYSHYRMGFQPFLAAVLPPCLAGVGLLAALCLAGRNTAFGHVRTGIHRVDFRRARPFAVLFLLAVLGVFDVLDYRLVFAAAVALVLVKGRNLAQQVDYGLLATFIAFFVFVGNIAHVPAVERALDAFVGPRPYAAAVLASQAISNVPAAILLSRFTDDFRALLAGVSVGGCGTLIASMASLISYKLYARAGGERMRYLVVFTAVNVLFLVVMTLAWRVASGGF